jgi:YHS domain-containing protein
MKKGLILGSLTVLLFACNAGADQQKGADVSVPMPQSAAPAKDSSMPTPTDADKFAGVQFASQRDTICNMSIKSGVEDTLHLGDKIYGFCSTGCKEEFVAQLVKEKKR